MADIVLQVVGFQYVVRPHLLWKPYRRVKEVMERGAANVLKLDCWSKSANREVYRQMC